MKSSGVVFACLLGSLLCGRGAAAQDRFSREGALATHVGLELIREADVERRFFGHTGGNKGYRCWLLATRTGGNGLAILTNGDEWDAVAAIGTAIIAEYGW